MKFLNLTLIVTIFLMSVISFADDSAKEFLDVHNEARAEVGAPPLKWNDTIATYARKYADSMTKTCEMEHSYGPYGESLASGLDMTPAAAVKYWLTEKPFYDAKAQKCVKDECLHYVAIIWKDTRYLGCARSKCDNGNMFVICNYDPMMSI